MSAVVVSARSRGRALRHHQEELLREGDAGVDANVYTAQIKPMESDLIVVPLRLQ
jgi:hypothetical protein